METGEPKTISQLIQERQPVKVVKPRKDSERQEYIGKLSEATGRTKKSIYFTTLHFPTSWLRDALSDCLHFTDPQTRNFKFGEWIKLAKGD
jgi:hypothetical protein